MVPFMQVPPFSLSKQLSEIGKDLDAAVLRVLRSGHYIGGEEVRTFENSFALSIGVPHVVGCNSGTDALIIALRALDIGPGDEVITCSFSFFATAEAISAVGAKPVFVEVNPSTYLIELNDVEQAINSSTKAILPVHLFGCPVDMSSLMDLANKYGLKVVEDCAQATGAKWDGRSVGSWGDVGCFSFFPTKNLGAAGDGGAISTKDSGLAKRMRELAVHGMPRRYVHHELGYNSRLDSLQAAVLNVKLPKLSIWVKQRQDIALRYQKLLADIPGLELPSYPSDKTISHAWNQFVVRVNKTSLEIDPKSNKINSCDIKSNPRDCLQDKLKDREINTIIYYPIPIHLQPAYQYLSMPQVSLPVTEKLCTEVLSLPMFPELTIDQQLYVVDTLKLLFEQSGDSCLKELV